MKPKNIKEAKELVLRYESIDLEEIRKAFHMEYDPALELTGFGDSSKCSLCVVRADTRPRCRTCIYGATKWSGLGWVNGASLKTYNRIAEASTPVKLRNAFKARARYIRSRLKELGEEMK